MEEELGGKIPLGFSVSKDLFEKASTAFRTRGEFLPRGDVENNQAILQAIVYGIISDGKHVLGLWRKQRESNDGAFKETRHNKKIGLASGGHIEPEDDINNVEFFNKAILREFSEELDFQEVTPVPKPAGIIMYEESLFDRVHLGLIYAVHVEKVGLAKNNDEYEKAEFLTPEQLSSLIDGMEGWGKVIADAIITGKFKINSQ
jgi:predicted NUDIX family phosphoesterase